VQCEFNKLIQTSEFEVVWYDIRKNKDENRIKRENRNPHQDPMVECHNRVFLCNEDPMSWGIQWGKGEMVNSNYIN